MEATNLGSIFASVTLDTKPLAASISSTRNALSEMARSLASVANQCATLQVHIGAVGSSAQAAAAQVSILSQVW